MSYYRSKSCGQFCCSPESVTGSLASWSQFPNTPKVYNVNPLHGDLTGCGTVTVTTALVVTMPDPVGGDCEIDGWDATFTMTKQTGLADCDDLQGTGSLLNFDNDWIGCQSGYGGGDPCGITFEDEMGFCWDSCLTESCCGTPSGGDNMGLLVGENALRFATLSETDWVATGIYLSGVVEDFVGYPTVVEGCHAWRRDMKKITAEPLDNNGGMRVRWHFKDGSYKYLDFSNTNNRFTDFADCYDDNNDLGIYCLGSGENLWDGIRLGHPDDTDQEYEITETATQFYYLKPDKARISTAVYVYMNCPNCAVQYGCVDCCCGFRSATGTSAWAQKLLATDVEDGAGDCIWDVCPNGSNYGSWSFTGVDDSCMKIEGTITIS